MQCSKSQNNRFETAPDLGGGPRGPVPGPPTMPMCLAICTTCACHLVVFISEESLFEALLNYRSSRRQYFTWILFDIVPKQLLHLLFSWKSVRYLNLVNARSSHVERTSLRVYSLLLDFASALFTVDLHKSHMSSIVKWGYHTFSFWSTCPLH